MYDKKEGNGSSRTEREKKRRGGRVREKERKKAQDPSFSPPSFASSAPKTRHCPLTCTMIPLFVYTWRQPTKAKEKRPETTFLSQTQLSSLFKKCLIIFPESVAIFLSGLPSLGTPCHNPPVPPAKKGGGEKKCRIARSTEHDPNKCTFAIAPLQKEMFLSRPIFLF